MLGLKVNNISLPMRQLLRYILDLFSCTQWFLCGIMSNQIILVIFVHERLIIVKCD